mmetsp:Transcript_1274/g.3576  ORF Transcript_1274/g.3576 Transcript_1274/m.3576 type:complete len:359 (+) Transcript_1274:271-1347(+)
MSVSPQQWQGLLASTPLMGSGHHAFCLSNYGNRVHRWRFVNGLKGLQAPWAIFGSWEGRGPGVQRGVAHPGSPASTHVIPGANGGQHAELVARVLHAEDVVFVGSHHVAARGYLPPAKAVARGGASACRSRPVRCTHELCVTLAREVAAHSRLDGGRRLGGARVVGLTRGGPRTLVHPASRLLGRRLRLEPSPVELEVGERARGKLLYVLRLVSQELVEKLLPALGEHGSAALRVLVRQVLHGGGGVQLHLPVALLEESHDEGHSPSLHDAFLPNFQKCHVCDDARRVRAQQGLVLHEKLDIDGGCCTHLLKQGVARLGRDLGERGSRVLADHGICGPNFIKELLYVCTVMVHGSGAG